MTQTAQMIQSWWIFWILDKLSTSVFMEQDRAGDNDHDRWTFVIVAFRKTNYLSAFPWSKKIIDKHVLFSFTINSSVWKSLENAALVCSRKLQKNIQVNNASYALPFPWRRKTTDEQFTFSWPLLLIILCENDWKMQCSRARENYRKTFKKTGYSLAFSWCRITCDELRVFLEFYWGWTVNLPFVFRYKKTLA